MLQLKSKAALAHEAMTLAQSFGLVHYRNRLYVPVHYVTGDFLADGDPEEVHWIPMSVDDVRRLAASQFSTLFSTDSELRSFYFMAVQAAEGVYDSIDTLLVKTADGLRQLDPTGQLVVPTGEFVANTLQPVLNEDKAAKKEIRDIMLNWVDNEAEVESLLHHLATVLAPGWSAVKYVLLIGEGRNGKGVLIGMMQRLFGKENMSHVPRQELAKRSPMVIDLNGKLLNLVLDGSVEYIKDSGTEKTLTAGEPAYIKDLFVSAPVTVQTNALFVEALNSEPMSRDKSSALQKRLVRFYFDKVFPKDLAFELHMWSDEMLGAFLSLLIDYYVQSDEIAEKLALTEASQILQMDHMYQNSHGLQFLKQMSDDGAEVLVGDELDEIVKKFIAWAKVTDGSTVTPSEAVKQLNSCVVVERKSKRVNGNVRKVKVIETFKPETQRFLDSLEGGLDEDAINSMVDD